MKGAAFHVTLFFWGFPQLDESLPNIARPRHATCSSVLFSEMQLWCKIRAIEPWIVDGMALVGM